MMLPNMSAPIDRDPKALQNVEYRGTEQAFFAADGKGVTPSDSCGCSIACAGACVFGKCIGACI